MKRTATLAVLALAMYTLLNLALFSPLLAEPRPDWPPHLVVTGFLSHDRDEPGHGASAPGGNEFQRALCAARHAGWRL